MGFLVVGVIAGAARMILGVFNLFADLLLEKRSGFPVAHKPAWPINLAVIAAIRAGQVGFMGSADPVKAMQDVISRIREFNANHAKSEVITGKSLKQSQKSRQRSGERTQAGTYLSKNREYLRSEGAFLDSLE